VPLEGRACQGGIAHVPHSFVPPDSRHITTCRSFSSETCLDPLRLRRTTTGCIKMAICISRQGNLIWQLDPMRSERSLREMGEHYAWKYTVALHEAWFYFLDHFDRIWLPHDELPSSFPKETIASQTLIITVVWNPHGFHVIQSLPKGIKWTGRYYCFSNCCSSRWRQSSKNDRPCR
jgi:hypothetical protein